VARVDLPTGLKGAFLTLSMGGERSVLERLTSLVWVRLATDPSMPSIGGHDPRSIFEDNIEWEEVQTAGHLDALGARVNEILDDPLLSTDWHELSEQQFAKVVAEVARWTPDSIWNDDPLGELSQRVRTDAAKSARGEYYTPYPICLMMTRMTAAPDGIAPGARVLDPACGSGRFLLAALEVCREQHGQVPEVFGIDISPDAVRLCKLNLTLAGIYPKHRVECADFLRMTPPEQLTPTQRVMQLELFKYAA
jgi:tRNA G10  N-methylase Trm11